VPLFPAASQCVRWASAQTAPAAETGTPIVNWATQSSPERPLRLQIGDSPRDPPPVATLWAEQEFDDSKWDRSISPEVGSYDPGRGCRVHPDGRPTATRQRRHAWYRIHVKVVATPARSSPSAGPADWTSYKSSQWKTRGQLRRLPRQDANYLFRSARMFSLQQVPACRLSDLSRLRVGWETLAAAAASAGGLHNRRLLGDAGAIGAN